MNMRPEHTGLIASATGYTREDIEAFKTTIRQVPEASELLDGALEALTSDLQELEKRLSVVLRPAAPVMAGESIKAPERVPLASVLHRQTTQVRMLGEQVKSIWIRLEL